MIQLECQTIAPGRCVWCGKDRDEVITIAFGDQSFVGSMCLPDFCKAIRMKLLTHNGNGAELSPNHLPSKAAAADSRN